MAVPAAGLYGLGLYGLSTWAFPNKGLALVAFFLGVPMAASALAVALAHRRAPRGVHRALAISGVVTSVLLVSAVVVLREGAICLVMAAPLFYGAGLVGGALAAVLLKGG